MNIAKGYCRPKHSFKLHLFRLDSGDVYLTLKNFASEMARNTTK